MVHVLAKAGAPWDGRLLGKRVTLLTDSVLGTRPVRAVVNAVIASVVKDPAVYVSAGLVFHQGPVGGGGGRRHHRGLKVQAPSRETSPS